MSSLRASSDHRFIWEPVRAENGLCSLTSSSRAVREQGVHLDLPPTALHRQMLLHHVRAQLITLARRHHRPLGHHDILLRQAGGKMEPLFDQ